MPNPDEEAEQAKACVTRPCETRERRQSAAIFGILFASATIPTAEPLGTTQEQASFHLADDQLAVELVASEPEVVSPVAIAWDADGRMFVAEMTDYPNSAEKGRIKLLEDRDGDGRYEKATVFADELPFPNGVLPRKNGVLVTAAPDIWFLCDTNRDGIADERRKVLSGFAEGNQQLRVNGLLWGFDNWIYGANGRSDGEVRWAGATSEKPVSLRGHDFRFQVDTGQFEAIAGRSQFGLARDDWGNRFLSWNTNPIRHEVLPERYLNRNRFLASTESVVDILEPGDSGRVYPLTPPPLTFNNESTIHFNALSGLTIYRGDALSEQYRGNAFVGESLRNLVHRRALEMDGPTFVARRVEREKEFLASTDPWFHPVNFATGPDGALYIVDFYREFVEHPDFVRGPARNETAWRTGASHGRIWRIRPKGDLPRRKPLLSRATTTELVRELGNENGWWRDTAQRLLVERNERSAKPLLERLVQSSRKPEARVHALFTLHGLGALDWTAVTSALKDNDARVRAHAVTWAGEMLARTSVGELRERLFRLQNDPDARVRFQLALVLGDLDETHAALAHLAQSDFTNRWHSLAILSSLGKAPTSFLIALVTTNRVWLSKPSPSHARFMEQVAKLVGANHTDSELEQSLALIGRTSHPAARVALLAGVGDGLARAGKRVAKIAGRADVVHEAASAVVNADLELPMRLSALRVATLDAGVLKPNERSGIVLRLLQPDQPNELQSAAASAVGDLRDASLAQSVFAAWSQFAIGTRRELLRAALRSSIATGALVEALESGTVSFSELDATMQQSLQNHKDAALKPGIAKLLQTVSDSNAPERLRSFEPALRMKGEQLQGAAVFAKLCLSCHSIGQHGAHVGPELSAIGSRPSEAVLVDVLDPSRQISPDFLSYTVSTAKGETLTGLIASETAASVTLRRQGQPDTTILRSEVAELRADTKSLMPDGLEQGLTTQDLADLLAFLRQPDASLLPK